MNGVMGKAGKVWIRAGKVILATAACIARCCGGGEYYYLALCPNADAPPEVPRFIAVRIPFGCDGCPLSANRIVIYLGYCYQAWGPDDPCTPLACAGGLCESQHHPKPPKGGEFVIVNALDLQCKPLDANCNTVPCVPEETGCCSQSGRVDCPDGSFAICNRPKRWRVSCIGSTQVTEWCSDSPSDCSSWAVSLRYTIRWEFWNEFQCIEDGSASSQATCRAGGGKMVIAVESNNPYYDPMLQYAGTWTVLPLSGSVGGYLGGISGYDAVFQKGAMTSGLLTTLPIGFPACGVNVPAGSQNEIRNCRDGRSFRRVTAAPAGPDDIQGTLSEKEYNDCNHYNFSRDVAAFDVPYRCAGQPRWEEHIKNQKQFVFVIGCPQQPPQLPMPNDAAEFLGLPAPVIGTGDMI